MGITGMSMARKKKPAPLLRSSPRKRATQRDARE